MGSSNSSFFEKVMLWIKNSITIKLIIIAFLILILQVPLGMVKSLVNERQYRQAEVTEEISRLWGGQVIIAPFILTLPFWEYSSVTQKENGIETTRQVKHKKYLHFLPKTLYINGDIDPEIRYRSIYEVAVYKSKLDIDTHFETPDFSSLGVNEDQIIWDEAHLNMGISELRGIEDPGMITINGEPYAFDPGIPSTQNLESGIHTYFKLDSNVRDISIQFQLRIKGSKNLAFIPLGEKSTVDLRSEWTDPSFMGAFLPSSSTINHSGFMATWKVSHLNRNYPQSFINGIHVLNNSIFGVDLFLPVDNYAQVHRAGKYGMMFIALNFLIFFFMQVLKKVRMHGIQYLLVGMAICVFFTLLIALSEHLGFVSAYWISCTASSLMIAIYSLSFLKNMHFALVVLTTLFAFFGYMFVAIQQQDYALLFGSIGLFVILALVMFFSRKFNWNQSPNNTVEKAV